ncbi:MAG TPA: polysaccharide biosynthesis tyrosine autokinase [Pyrinomonadaceae bacterium]|nr:polysaccharide biosynthesis tyrosine autokinase [Pyrinomonadaceae bacterium]
MMSHDNRLLPVSALDRSLDRPLADIAQSKPYGVSAEPTTLRDYLFIVLKRKWLILSLVLVVTSLVTIQMFRLPSLYQGETTIKIEPKPRSVLQTKDLVITGANDPNFWGTQLKLLENPDLARKVVLTLDLRNNPSFFGGQSQGGIFSSLRRIFSRQSKPAAETTAPSSGLELVAESEPEDKVLSAAELASLEPYEDAIIENESVEPIPGTNLVRIKFVHADPLLAQKIANTLAEVFVRKNLDLATAGSTKAEDVLAKEIANLQGSIKTAQETQFNYAKAHNLPLTPDSGGNLEAERLATLSRQVLDAENERKSLQAQYDAASKAADPYAIPEVQNSERIGKLRERISLLKERRDALLTVYTKEWPEVRKIDAQLAPLEAELLKAPSEVVSAMKSKYEAAASREQSLRSAYNQQRATTTQQTQDQIEMLARSQEIETNKQYLNTLLQRQRELQVTSNDRGNEVSITETSRVPKTPIGPPRLRNILIAFLLSLVAGVGLAFLLDFLDDTVKSIEDVDRYLHLPALALIPASRPDRTRLMASSPSPMSGPETTALAMVDDVRSPVAESYRHLRTSLLLSSAGQPPKTILVTSSQPSEGKTTTAINTAFMLAQTGAEVLIIDCDLRRPRLHAHFEVPNTTGLTNLLSGESDLERLIQPYERQPNLKLLTSGPVPPNPAELLGSEEMRRMLALLGERFSHIIIDSPPAISFTDASILSTMVDGVVLVVHGGRSSRAVVRRAKQQLLDVGAHIFGVVLNNVKLETQDYYYYSGYYSGYYTDENGNPEGSVGEAPAGR